MIKVDIDRAKVIAHKIRREERAKEFAPLDDMIAKQIPGFEQAEAKRQAIREKYAKVQDDIDAVTDVAGLNAAMALL